MSENKNFDIPQLDCYCLEFRKATHKIVHFYDTLLAPAGINSHQFTLLVILNRMGPLSVTELAKEMELDRTTLSRNLKVLENYGMIEDCPQKGRRRRIEISKYGDDVLRRAYLLWKDAQNQFETILDKKQCKQLLEQLKMICETL